MKTVKLPYPVSFQELLKISVQPIQSNPTTTRSKKKEKGEALKEKTERK